MQDVNFEVLDGLVKFSTETSVLGVELLDVEGRVLAAEWRGGLTSFDASAQAKGVYLLRLYLEGGVIATYKFVR